MKLVIKQEQLMAVVTVAKRIPELRIGQHVTNVFLDGTALGEHSMRLFYCDDSEFWDTVFDFITYEQEQG